MSDKPESVREPGALYAPAAPAEASPAPAAAPRSGYFLTEEDQPRTDHLITEDSIPVDNWLSERNLRLLVQQLYSGAWRHSRYGDHFIAAADVGLFARNANPALVPDVFLSLNVVMPAPAPDLKKLRSYFFWEFGKGPDVVIEIVSNRVGGEMTDKLLDYQELRIPYYVVYDPFGELAEEMKQQRLAAFEWTTRGYQPTSPAWLDPVEVGLTLWHGQFEGLEADWLRWCNRSGTVVPTSVECATQERERADEEAQRANQEHERANQEHERAERLAERLRALGIDPTP